MCSDDTLIEIDSRITIQAECLDNPRAFSE